MTTGLKRPSYQERVRELGLFRLKRRRLWECLKAAFLYLKVGRRNLKRDFFPWVCSDSKGGMALN